MEGAACVVGSPNKTLSESKNYQFACQQATREANAAAKALFDSGATQVLIWDNHMGSLNLNYNELDERCDIALGTGFEHSWPGLDNTFSGALLVAYHSMDNTENAVLAHTFSSTDYQWMKINDIEVGEIAVHAAAAGDKGVPIIFVSGDDKCCTEAERLMHWVCTVSTKTSLGWNMAISKHPQKVVNEIYEGTKKAVEKLMEGKKIKVFKFQKPLNLQIRFKRIENAQKIFREQRNWSSIDPYTLEKSFEKIEDYF